MLATKYGSFIPALSEHNAGGTNVGRTLINGERIGADDVRTRYFWARSSHVTSATLPGKEYEDVYRSYGPRSYLYAEMVFGNTFIVKHLMASTPQAPIYAMRTPRAITLAEIVDANRPVCGRGASFQSGARRTGSAQVTLYLPSYVSEFGATWRSGAGRPARRMWRC